MVRERPRIPSSSLEVSSIDTLDETADAATYPCISKPVLGHVGERVGNHRTRLVRDRLELVQRVRAALSDGVSMLVTEYVPGGEENLEAAVTVPTSDGSFPLAYGEARYANTRSISGRDRCTAPTPCPRRSTSRGGCSTKRVSWGCPFSRSNVTSSPANASSSRSRADPAGLRARRRVWRRCLMASLRDARSDSPRSAAVPPARGRGVIPVLEARAAWARLTRGDTTVASLLCSYRGTREVSVLDLRDPGPALALRRRGARILGRRFLAHARRAKGGTGLRYEACRCAETERYKWCGARPRPPSRLRPGRGSARSAPALSAASAQSVP